jgi:fatty-acyl-CoA synthase
MSTVSSGMMMDFPLTIHHLLWRMRNVYGSSRVVTVLDTETHTATTTFREIADNAERLAAGLAALGVRTGDRVGTFSWNHAAHLEAYYGVMGMGAVLHTVNLRLHPDQIAWTIEHAKDRVILLDAALAEQFAPLLSRLPTVEHVVVIGPLPEGVVVPGAVAYDEVLAGGDGGFAWPELDENTAASLCYTSGTTGDPKGVLYSHRSIVLHALLMAGTETFRIRNVDRVLAAVPMFHVMGWGLPFVAAVVGCDLIMPNRYLQPAALARVIRAERVTWSAGVPTIWMDLLHHLEDPTTAETAADLASLERLVVGGTQVPVELMRRFERAFGVLMVQGWGMTEVFSGAVLNQDQPQLQPQERWALRAAAGRVSPFYEIRVVDAERGPLPHDGHSQGELEVRGPCVAADYLDGGPGAQSAFHDGWLRTGDVATVDAEGWVRVTDRAKDGIKSGGEWISSVDLEIALMEHPAVREAAVVARPDPRWSERPHAFVVTTGHVSAEELREFLGPRVARWWIPDSFDVVTDIPRTSTGKFDKKLLRARLQGRLEVASAPRL